MEFSFRKNPLFRFLSLAMLLYVVWYVLYNLWLNPQGILDNFVIDNLIVVSSYILKLLGYSLIENPYSSEVFKTMRIEGAGAVWIGVPCNGVSLFALFTGFIIAYPGKIINKLMYIPLGLLSIHVINAFRVVALCITAYKFPQYLDFNHNYTFTIIVYAYVFFLWILWTNKFSK